jgi:hypothetical protein
LKNYEYNFKNPELNHRLFLSVPAQTYFFARDPEEVHDRMTAVGSQLGKYFICQNFIGWMFNYSSPPLEQNLLGIKFANPIGLSADAYRKIKLGASLVQLITGMIFKGPQLVSQINSGLVELLRRDGYKNISEAIGITVK